MIVVRPDILLDVHQLSALATDLRPSNLPERVRAIVLGHGSSRLDLEDMDIEGDHPLSEIERLEAIARQLGAEVAADQATFEELLPDLFRGGSGSWAFGRGLAAASPDPRTTWARLAEELEQIPMERRNVQVLKGFLAELWVRNRELVQHLLDSAVDQPLLLPFLPALHSAVGLDERGVGRLKLILRSGQVPATAYGDLASGRLGDLEGGALTDLLLLIADQANGLDVAFEILYSRLILDSSTNREHEPKLLEAGRDLLQRIEFRRDNNQDYRSVELVKSCLADPNANSIAARIALRLRSTVASHETSRFDNVGVLAALLEVQPVAVLDALFAGDENDQRAGLRVLAPFDEEFAAAADVITCDALLSWCEGDRERRYPLAAWIITFGHRPEAGGPLDWSEKAKALLANAPDPRSVLEALINRFFRLRSLGGSRATLLEANAQLLDRLESHIPSGLLQLVNDAKAQLMREIARERQRETDEDRSRDERFEW